jgi:hypothetical protein
VNILSQVMPGLREVRTPFTTGLLWVAFGGILLSLLPEETWDREVFRDAVELMRRLPGEIMIPVALVQIYVLGILFEFLAHRMFRVFLIGMVVVGYVFAPQAMALIMIQSFSVLVPLTLFGMAILPLYAWLRSRRLRSTFYDALEDTISRWEDMFRSAALGIAKGVRESFESETAIFNELVGRELEQHYSDEFFTDEVGRLNRTRLYATASMMNMTVSAVRRESGIPIGEFRRTKTISDLKLRRDASGNDFDKHVRSVMLEMLRGSHEARAVFAEKNIVSLELRNSLRRRLVRVDLRLRVEYPEIFAQVDRLSAEGEFRTAVALPVTALLAILAYKWHLEFNAASGLRTFFYMCLAAGLIGMVLAYAGTRKTKESRILLYECTRSGIVVLPKDSEFGERVKIHQSIESEVPPSDSKRRSMIEWLLNTIKKRLLSRWTTAPTTPTPNSATPTDQEGHDVESPSWPESGQQG